MTARSVEAAERDCSAAPIVLAGPSHCLRHLERAQLPVYRVLEASGPRLIKLARQGSPPLR